MNETFTLILVAVLSGGIGAGVLKLIGDRLAWKRERTAKKEDKADNRTQERLKAIEEKTDAQSEALKYILYDRIRYLALSYISEGEIDFDDRRILNDMHKSYHYGLDGNGDLDGLMSQVNALPLKLK